MNNVLKRKLFNTPKYAHKSTGIASGLEYRPGYRVGGRVGYHTGALVDPRHNELHKMPGYYHTTAEGSREEDSLVGPEHMRVQTEFPEVLGPSDVHPPKSPYSPDLDTDKDYLTPDTDYLTESQRVAKLLAGEIPGTDYGKYAVDYDKYAIDYSKYEPSRLGAFGAAAGETIKGEIPAGVSQIGNFFANLSTTSADYKSRRDELDLMAEQDAKKMSMMTEEQKQDLAFKRDQEIRADKKAEAATAVELYKGSLDRELEREEIQANMAAANAELENRLAVANIGAAGQLAVQSLINAQMPDKLVMMLTLQKPKEEGGMNLSADDAFATVFGQRDDQIQFASTLLQAFSASIIPGQPEGSNLAVQKTIQTMNLLFPGVFNLTESDVAELMQNVSINQDGTSYKGIKS